MQNYDIQCKEAHARSRPREHHFEIEPIDGERSRLVQREIFRGLLVSLFAGTRAKIKQGFEQMNRALKVRSESDVSS